MVDASNTARGDATSQTTFTISNGGTCSANACWATTAGDYKVTGTSGGFSGFTYLHVDHGPVASSAIVVNGLVAPGGNLPSGASTDVTVTASDSFGNRWDVTPATSVKLDGASCTATCGPFAVGAHSITATPTGSGVPAPAAVTVVGKAPATAGKRLFSWGPDADELGDGGPARHVAPAGRHRELVDRPRIGGLARTGPALGRIGLGVGQRLQRRSSARTHRLHAARWVPGTGTTRSASSVFA